MDINLNTLAEKVNEGDKAALEQAQPHEIEFLYEAGKLNDSPLQEEIKAKVAIAKANP